MSEDLEDDGGMTLYIREALLSLVGEGEAQLMARKAHIADLLAPDRIASIAHLVSGDDVGWQSRFAAACGVSRTHVALLLSGKRPVTEPMREAIATAAEDAAKDFEKRAAQLRKRAAQLRF